MSVLCAICDSMAGVTTLDRTADRPVAARRVSQKVAALAPSATLAVDARARSLRAQGEDVISFGAGEPDFPTSPHIVEAAVTACSDPVNHHYTGVSGLAELREAIAAKTKRDSGLEVEPSQVVVTNGAKQAVYETFFALVDPGDEVLVPAPYWTTYPEVVSLAGGTPRYVETTEESGFHLTVEALEAALTPATKILLFVSPNNPTGAVLSPEEVTSIGRWAADRGLWVVTDEIYEHLVYGDRRFTSLPVAVPEAVERCVVINGVAKTHAMTGWRVGWLIGPPDVSAAATALQSQATSNVCNVAQQAALAAVDGNLGHAHAMRDVFDARRRLIHEALNKCQGVSCVEPEGAFYAFPSVRRLLGRRVAGRMVESSADLAELAIDEAKVAVVPGEAFGAPGYFRMSYALGEAAIEEGVSRLAALFVRAD
jgi:aspartate aminotransferase